MDRKKVSKLISLFMENDIIGDINRSGQFYDEPPLSLFAANLSGVDREDDSEYIVDTKGISVGGASFESEENALMRCLGEAMERCSLYSYDNNEVKGDEVGNLRKISIKEFPASDRISCGAKIGWTGVTDIIHKKTLYAPAQLVYLNYQKQRGEQYIDCPVSTGAACGEDEEEVLLKGVYEVVERDAIMCGFLLKKVHAQIDINTIASPKIQKIYEHFLRYKIRWLLFDVQQDIPIPTYMSLLIDETGMGPALCAGSKAGFNAESAIIASAEEAAMGRIWLRYATIMQPKRSSGPVRSRMDHGLYWSDMTHLKEIQWLLNTPMLPMAINDKDVSIPSQLDRAIRILQEQYYNVYYKDISYPLFKEQGYTIYKVIIPGMQSLYFDELKRKPYINTKRLQQIVGSDTFDVNPTPHPFL